MKRSTILSSLAVLASMLAAGAALAGGTGGRGVAVSPPATGKACAKIGAKAKTARGVKLVCAGSVKTKKLVWVVLKPSEPATGKACAKIGAKAKTARGVKLVCAGSVKTKKFVWVVFKPAAPAKPATPATPATPAPPATPAATPASGADPALVQKGKTLFQSGAGSQGIACARCHGMNALGDTAPKVTGKNETQVRTAIQTVPVMMPFFGDLSADEIQAIAAFLQSLGS